jgi:hypothetical protein
MKPTERLLSSNFRLKIFEFKNGTDLKIKENYY